MFVIPMVGKSSRFFKAGFSVPKYALTINGKSVFECAVASFEKYFKTDDFLFVVRDDFNAKAFVESEIARLGILNASVVELQGDTRGQAETVALGLEKSDASQEDEIFIFNIDTFRPGFVKPIWTRECDGYLEVFEGEGEHWSFVEPGPGQSVLRTTEKERISNLCSDGLYYFKNRSIFEKLFDQMLGVAGSVRGEYYIAPMYNYALKAACVVKYDLIDIASIIFCGTPDEYYAAGGSKV